MKIYKKVAIPPESRLFFVGDIHGQYHELLRKLKEVGFQFGRDYLISEGDLVDRGPKIAEVINFFMETPNCYSVIGNHDNFLLEHDTKPEKWFNDARNGSEATVKQLGESNLKKYKKLLLSHFSLLLEVEQAGVSFGVVHGGVPFDNDKPQQWHKIIRKAKRNKGYRANLMWDRTVIRRVLVEDADELPSVSGINYLIHGHTTLPEPLRFQNRYYIDTYGSKNELTLLHFDAVTKEMIYL